MELLCSKNYGHLGLVASVCDEIGLVELIDNLTSSDKQRKISVGLATKAMVLNGLGFANKALYLTPQFYKDKPVDILLGEGYEASDFDSHSLGSALDRLYEGGLTKIFFLLSLQSRKLYGVLTSSRHLDGTTFSVHHKGGCEDKEEGVISLKRGFNKQKRGDIPQFLLELITSNEEGIPEYIDFGDGNSTDKTEFPKVLKGYIEQMKLAQEDWTNGHYVADSAFYTRKTIENLEGLKWISRVPLTLKESEQGIKLSWRNKNGKPLEWRPLAGHEGYSYQEKTSKYGNVEQRWLIIHSKKSHSRASKSVETQIEKEYTDLAKGIKTLQKQKYESRTKAHQTVKTWYRSLASKDKKYHSLGELTILEKKRYGPGRRKADAIPKSIDYEIQHIDLQRKEKDIQLAKNCKSTFILATNDLDKEKLLPEKVLTLYKNDQQKTERGFKFLKDPLFMLDKIFLTLPRRIMALAMVMGICLLVYTLAQFKIRRSLRKNNETLPNQLNKPTSCPTMRWIFMLMQGLHVVYFKNGNEIISILTNLDQIQAKIIRLMGRKAQEYYPDRFGMA